MDRHAAAFAIREGRTSLGIELGSTRIKSVLIDDDHNILAKGSFIWENRLEDGLWTYSISDALNGIRESYRDLANNVREDHGVSLETIGCIGVSGMMHGYLPLDKEGNQLSRFLTWRNTNTTEAANKLTELFDFNIPLRWSIAQLYQAMLNGESHVSEIGSITTIAGYIHYRLTGKRVMGIGEASGMFPIDPETANYDEKMLRSFEKLAESYGYPWKIRDILPQVLTAGQNAGTLTEEGARLLDPTGALRYGIPMAPPEGDAGTGMTATNAVGPGTGNVSAGTSIFAMVVLEKNLSRLYRDIDIVTTPSGKPVAMVHCNNGTSELDAWMRVFLRAAEITGGNTERGALYDAFFFEALNGDTDCGGNVLYNFQSGEPVVGLTQGRPLLARTSGGELTLANLMRAELNSIMASLAVGMRILRDENVRIDRLTGHGGLFKTPVVAQKLMAAALNAPITVMEHAGEGGPYGMALLAAYLKNNSGESLEDYLGDRVFSRDSTRTMNPSEEDRRGFEQWLKWFTDTLPAEEAAVKYL